MFIKEKSKPDKVDGFLVEVTGPTVCFAYYSLVDPNSSNFGTRLRALG